MNENILKYLIENPSMALWTRDKNPVSCSKAICALANTNGGCVVVGIDDNMEVVCIDTTENEKFVKSINDNLQPMPPFSITQAEIGGKKVLLINVWEGNNKPYTTYDAFYTLRGNTICKASLEEVSEMSKSAHNLKYGWERQVVAGLAPEDLSQKTIERFKKALLESNRIAPDDMNTRVVRKLGFLKGENITNAGAVMLCDNPAIFIPQTRIRVSVFGTGDELIDVHLYDQNLLDAVDAIVDHVKSLYPKRIVINGLERTEIETLPTVALREGILNAVVHRLYDRYDSFVAINIHEDYLEIINSGSLPEGIKTSDLTISHRSILRNPDIANAFYTVKYIEMAGSGTLRIIDECKKCQCPTPTWSVTDDMVILRFNGVKHSFDYADRGKVIDLNSITSDASVRESLTRILEFMKTHENVKLNDVAMLLDKSYPSVKRYMRLLSDATLIEYKGNNRSGGWFIKSL